MSDTDTEPDDNTETLTVILGERRYRVIRPWGKLPASIRYGHISQLAVDSIGRVYVFQRGEPPLIRFEASGEFCDAWGQGSIADAHGISISADERVFLVDRDAHQILIFDTGGKRLGALGERHRPRFQAPFNHPTAVALAPDGEIYVADGYGNSAVHRFSADGTHLHTWGRPGAGPGEFSTPHGIWVDSRDRVLVVDRENNRIQLFDRQGKYIDEWRDFYHPMDLFEDRQGMVYVTDQIPRLSLLTPAGELAGRCRPVLNMPHGIWGNAAGDLFIAEMNPTRVTKLALVQ